MKKALCPLCRRGQLIVRSHLAAAGIYERLKTPEKEDSHSITMTPGAVGPTPWEVIKKLLCQKCDQRLAIMGENWVMEFAFNRGTFRLLEKLRLALPISPYSLPGADAFPSRALDVDIDKAAHFAVGLLWRAAVTTWRIPGSDTVFLNVGVSEMEMLRRYLKGETAFPSNVHVKVTACTDRMSHGLFVAPYETPKGPWHYRMMALGLLFDIYVGANIHTNLRHQSCMTEPNRVIFMQDCSRLSFATMATVNESARPTGFRVI